MADNHLLRVPLEERGVQLEIFAWFWSKKREFLWNVNYPNYQSMVNMNSANKVDWNERNTKKILIGLLSLEETFTTYGTS